jgi:hypothetical protein
LPIYRKLRSIAPEFKHVSSASRDFFFTVPNLPGTKIDSNGSYSTSYEWTAAMPTNGTNDDQYIGNAFNVRQLSFKFRLRTLPLIDYSWSSINSSNYISYKLMLLGPKSIADIANGPIFSGFPTPSDMFQDIPEKFEWHTPFTFPGCATHGDSPEAAPILISSSRF